MITVTPYHKCFSLYQFWPGSSQEIRAKTDPKARFRVDPSIFDEHLGSWTWPIKLNSEVHDHESFWLVSALEFRLFVFTVLMEHGTMHSDLSVKIILASTLDATCLFFWYGYYFRGQLTHQRGPCTYNLEFWRRLSKTGARTDFELLSAQTQQRFASTWTTKIYKKLVAHSDWVSLSSYPKVVDFLTAQKPRISQWLAGVKSWKYPTATIRFTKMAVPKHKTSPADHLSFAKFIEIVCVYIIIYSYIIHVHTT